MTGMGRNGPSGWSDYGMSWGFGVNGGGTPPFGVQTWLEPQFPLTNPHHRAEPARPSSE